MYGRDIIVIFMFIIYATNANFYHCSYLYNYSCDNKDDNVEQLANETQPLICSLDNIPDSAKYTLILSKDGLSSTGIMKVNLRLPHVTCNYKVALLVNETIKTHNDCEHYSFDDYNVQEIHSLQTICMSEYDNTTNEDSGICKEDDIPIYFEHVFTGCYALRYTIDDINYVVQSRKYISTSYQRREVEEPRFRCNYDNQPVDNTRGDLVPFTFDIYVLYGSASMTLQLLPVSSDHDNKGDACVKYSKAPEYSWDINLGINDSRQLKHCNIEKVLDNGTYAEHVDCSFALPTTYNISIFSYCFLIALNDNRCARHTTWNPPPKNELAVPCTWISQCTRVMNPVSPTEFTGGLDGDKIFVAELSSLLPIAGGMIILIAIISAVVYYFYRSRTRINHNNLYLNPTLRELKDANSIELDGIDTDDDNEKIGKLPDHARAILLLYARGSKHFMSFMLHFREILECYCGCHVYDWYAACEWDAVARIGACEWADCLIKRNNRVVWIDTPTARSLINMRNTLNKSSSNEQLNTDLINDFRDLAFPSVLEYAKRTIMNFKQQYDKHFIVRIEGFNHDNVSEDPFSNLSPHARFLIPYHLKQLCSHLSAKRSEAKNEALTDEQIQLKERLKNMKNHI